MWLYTLGFLAQAFFFARILLQWILSEKAKKVVSPVSFWVLSIAGSYLLFIYGWLRDDFAIILGQFISYYIYLWNLREKGVWQKTPLPLRVILLFTPVLVVVFAFEHSEEFVLHFFKNEEIPFSLLLFGAAGQIIFTLRFVYQWIYSYRRNVSVLPVGFWIISLVGSFVIISYGIFRHDPVLILGQSMGFVAYFRNIVIAQKNRQLQ